MDTNHSDDIGFIQARSEELDPMILFAEDPEDCISTQMRNTASESSSGKMKEEEDEESMIAVEGVPRKRKAFRDGSLFAYEVLNQLNTVFHCSNTKCFHNTTHL